ncbi:nuclear transport factor 2 family protein [Halioxenophilus aromaticivorans]|uniref:SnoaL-like domain-containing protein n=1 Tax=Halioxenophilus aromaticivorans TaxID=1306992 RepID=A0AAV3U6N6_9ALTE
MFFSLTKRRRSLVLLAFLSFTAPIIAVPSQAASAHNSSLKQKMAETVATQKIEYLRRQYARATDLIGLNTPEGIAQGRALYQRVFTPDAKIRTVDGGEVGFEAQGPDAWVDVAAGALKVFANTQHLIGTQLVTIEQLPDKKGQGGQASMSSYLQAWHDAPGEKLDIFIGVYHDKMQYTPGVGWQIYDMTLEKISGEVVEK